MIVKDNMDTGGCYEVKKCTQIAFRKVNMIKIEELTVLEEKMDALNPS